MADETFEVSLTFNDKGELINVVEIGLKKTTNHGEHIPIDNLCQVNLKKMTNHSVLFTWGSPGCVIFKTSNGYVQICK